MSELRHVIRSILNAGITKDLRTIDALKLRIVNRLTMIGGLVIIVLMGINTAIGNYQGIAIDLVGLALVIAPVLWFNMRFRYKLATYWFVIGTHLIVLSGTAHAILQGRDNGIEHLLIAGAFMILVLLEGFNHKAFYILNLTMLCGAVYFRSDAGADSDEVVYIKLMVIWAVVYLVIYFFVSRYRNQLMVVLEKLERANVRLIESEKELRISNRAKDRLFSIVAHDLKAPLNLLRQLLDPEVMKVLDMDDRVKHQNNVRNRILVMEGSMRNLLDWAAHQLSNPQPNPVAMDVKRLVNHVVDLFKELMEQKNLKMEIDIPEGFGVTIDPNHFEIVLRNILHNAIKFSPKKGTVHISARDSSAGKVVSIRDQGKGVDVMVIENIIKGQSSNSESGTLGEKGSGIGLSFCVELLQKNHCKLQVGSTDKGAVFEIHMGA